MMGIYDLGDREAVQRFLLGQRRRLGYQINELNHAIAYNKLVGIDIPEDVLNIDEKLDILASGLNKAMKDIFDIKEVLIEKGTQETT